MQVKTIISISSLNLLALIPLNGAIAQVNEYDQVYPNGAGETIIERRPVRPLLRGRVREDFDSVKTKMHHRHFYPADDTVYGKTIELNIGMGGAHFD